MTIVSYGAAVHWALETLDNNPNISADLIDLRSLQPWIWIVLLIRLKKLSVLFFKKIYFGGIASDISAQIMEQAFEYLDAPVQRVGSLNTPIPFANSLEQQYQQR